MLRRAVKPRVFERLIAPSISHVCSLAVPMDKDLVFLPYLALVCKASQDACHMNRLHCGVSTAAAGERGQWISCLNN
jgi:hypothetical protein